MPDRFRDLEVPGKPGRKDAVLLATVSSFEDMAHPTRNDLQQFSDLFLPLFAVAGDEARRMASAALSRCPNVPRAVAETIARQTLDVAAPFLVHAIHLDEELLMMVLRTQSSGHARAVARREGLTQPVIDALAALNDSSVNRSLALRNLRPVPAAEVSTGAGREEQIRTELRALVMRNDPKTSPRNDAVLPRVDPAIEQRLIRYATSAEPLYFTTALADALQSGFGLAERIMLDVSGRQLAETLVALGLRYTVIIVALEQFFPHLAELAAGERRSLSLLRGCAFTDCVDRVKAWQRADRATRNRPTHLPFTIETEAPRPSREQPKHPQPAARATRDHIKRA
ncbi:DUF2336 domain-containing protein [Pararhizobium haloflavum]|uniref:DUF2336 domain-containing protein n=1 Tax=Pararhizobium haloflavum TaxID=2037914 RepID=UPI000C194590|nr:DUF2336 domain-containing protein [Pararhizobium haloflavum]